MLKVKALLDVPVSALLECTVNPEVRASWDKSLYGFKTFYTSEDNTESRVTYCFKSPVKGIADRDFYMR